MICPHCHQHLEFAAVSPRFCSHCGQPLGAGPPLAEAATLPPRQPGDTDILPPALAGDDSPPTVGPYRLIRPLGGGGMGAVYEAEETASGRHVALKLIRPEYADSPEAMERFRQEGQLASKLAHPRCVFVLAADEDRGQPYIVMELMTGSTLEDFVKQHGPLAPEPAIRKMLDVIEGLEEAHRLGLIHRDVKPSNCFVEENGRVKVGDFGLAKSLLRPAHLTRSGTFVGTPLYAAPEQIKREAVDARSDVYSVAATLYFLLTGRAPFQSGDPMAAMARIVADEAPSLRTLRPELPKALDKVVLRGLERDPKRRWRSLEDFRQALLVFLPAEPSVSGLGLRLVAFLLDELLIFIAGLGLHRGFQAILAGELALVVIGNLGRAAFALAYYGTLEGIWGRSLGKWLLRLRVGTGATNRVPGVGRALLRAAILYVLLNFTEVLDEVLHVSLPEDEEHWRRSTALDVLLFGLFLFGVGLLVCTMRKRNGYRGLHEVLSDTRTYRLRSPRARKRRPLEATDFQLEVQQADVPEQIGPYRIRGALCSSAEQQTLLGDDLQLGRTVWIVLRPESEPSLAENRRAVARMARLRWVSSGTLAGRQWDAFLAPAGCPLPALVEQGRTLSWAEFRGMLSDLTEELQAACADGTLPPSLTPEQVWVHPTGRAQLVELPFGSAAPEAGRIQPSADDQQRALWLLRDVAALALEGGVRSPGRATRRAPLPLYAAHFMSRLGIGCSAPLGTSPGKNLLAQKQAGAGPGPYERLDQLQADLAATETEPAEITRGMRAYQLGEQAVYALVAFLAHVMLLGISAITLEAVGFHIVGERRSFFLVFSIPPLLFSCFLLSVYVTRGGLSFLRHGIAIVRADGRPASRLRCLCRAIIPWVPAALLAALGGFAVFGVAMIEGILEEELQVDDLTVFGSTLSELAPWLGLGVLVLAAVFFIGYVAFILRNPARAPHDILAGTYLVPR